jgi:PKHD-type hydroxylase
MTVHIRSVLTEREVAGLRDLCARAEWQDGRGTASGSAAEVKRNLQIANRSEIRKPLDSIVMPALERNAALSEHAFPKKIAPPTYNHYDGGMTYGSHVDSAILFNGRMRADLSFTIFLSDPNEYDGGELVLQTSAGETRVKNAAGDMVLYPTTALHYVEPVRRGSRLAAVSWIESYVPDERHRAVLSDLIGCKLWMEQGHADAPETTRLRNSVFNLLRLWWQT